MMNFFLSLVWSLPAPEANIWLFQLLNAPLCSPASCSLCLSTVRCRTRSGESFYSVILWKVARNGGVNQHRNAACGQDQISEVNRAINLCGFVTVSSTCHFTCRSIVNKKTHWGTWWTYLSIETVGWVIQPAWPCTKEKKNHPTLLGE